MGRSPFPPGSPPHPWIFRCRQSLRRAEAEIRYFKHNDFLLHGSLARAFNREQTAEVRRNYDRLAQTVRAFFDAHLRGAPGDWERLLGESREEFRVRERAP